MGAIHDVYVSNNDRKEAPTQRVALLSNLTGIVAE